MRGVRIVLCETFASPYARHSHRLMRDVRIALCEKFVSLYTRHSHRLIRDIRIARYEKFVSLDTGSSYHSMRGGRSARICKNILSDAGKAMLIRLPIPVVFGIAAFHLFADFVPCVVPKMFYVVGDLQRAAGR